MAEETKTPVAKPVAPAPAPAKPDDAAVLRARVAELEAKLAAATAPPPPAKPEDDGPGTYQLSYLSHSASVKARDRREAQAIFFDSIKVHPGPKAPGLKIVKVAA